MSRKYDVSDERSIHIQTQFGPIELCILVNNEPAWITKVEDGDEMFELTTESGNDNATVILIGDHNEDELRERYG